MKIKDCGIYTSRKGEKFVFDDIVREADEGVYFISKNRLPKINDIDINTLDIIELIKTSRYLYEIYVDEVYNELYIITSDKGLYEDREQYKETISLFYYGNVTLSDIIYDPKLYNIRIGHKADKDKLKGIVENYRLTKIGRAHV